MTAIQATFSDFKLIKSRSVVQLVLELPIEAADAALASLGGIPQPGMERWVAVAPLNLDSEMTKELQDAMAHPGVAEAEALRTVKTKDEGLAGTGYVPEGERLRIRAVMLCKDERFQDWAYTQASDKVLPSTFKKYGGRVLEPDVAGWLRTRLGIKSRAELATNLKAQVAFLNLEAQYKADVGLTAEDRS